MNVAAIRLRHQAEMHQLTSEAATRQLDILSNTVKDPVAATSNLDRPDYSAIVHKVSRGKEAGELTTASEVIVYERAQKRGKSKAETRTVICGEIKSVTPAKKKVRLRLRKGSASFNTSSYADSNEIAGDIYLACPSLTM